MPTKKPGCNKAGLGKGRAYEGDGVLGGFRGGISPSAGRREGKKRPTEASTSPPSCPSIVVLIRVATAKGGCSPRVLLTAQGGQAI